ncbi:hypothetical protein SEA_WESAK_16 [Microbacterium phage Wesak]|uniref:Uncharacterized protein n=1 Tax=Microbacterium phage Wesak TaxID=2653751 RepID=A0A5Q2WLM5_9CAUD|nr:hypothetical protein SEA_WESAK_16 [Microbacterium phage Wesak]
MEDHKHFMRPNKKYQEEESLAIRRYYIWMSCDHLGCLKVRMLERSSLIAS